MDLQSKISVLLSVVVFASEFPAEPSVRISQGLIIGTKFETRKGRIVSAFIGVPYAQPPIGDLRFQNPLPVIAWNGTLLAKEEASVCPQNFFGTYLGHEDCLYLNVFTPLTKFDVSEYDSTSRNNLLPVMVYIHGGEFNKESTNLTAYSPKHLMDKDIIFVSMNYRLGLLSFFTTGDLVNPGNLGLKDQVLALKWVQKNIRAFGGDSKRVTLFGNSAGGASVNYLALSDATNGLFHQYIIQSGNVFSPWGYQNVTLFMPFINELANRLGCPNFTSTALANCLREIDVMKLVMTAEKTYKAFPEVSWIPMIELETEEAVLTDTPLNLLSRNKLKDLPFMSGTTADEGLLFTLGFYLNMESVPVVEVLENHIDNISSHYSKPVNITKFKNLVMDFYFKNLTTPVKDRQLLKNFTNFVSDNEFFYPQVILFDKMAKWAMSPNYMYSFGYRGKTNLLSLEFNITEDFGVCHAEELLYLFPKGAPKGVLSAVDEKVVDIIVDLWTSFAKNGKPTSDELDDPDLWQPYNTNGSFLQIGNITNKWDPSITLERNFFSERMHFWKTNFPLDFYQNQFSR